MTPDIQAPHLRVDVVEKGLPPRRGWIPCDIGTNVKFDTASLESYCSASYEEAVYDCLLLAAAIEFCDRVRRRSTQRWGRYFELRLPVHDPDRWGQPKLRDSLKGALTFLTGDNWHLSFVPRREPAKKLRQQNLRFPDGSRIIVPYSDGLDSHIVSSLLDQQPSASIIRVRLGTTSSRSKAGAANPFAAVPYKVSAGKRQFVESSGRSRGFKFMLLAGIAAYLSSARTVVIPESGQGALGPALVVVGQAYEDYRNHPLFAQKMSAFLGALFSHSVDFVFPRIWHTKGETLAEFLGRFPDTSHWQSTRSCWQSNRHVSVDHRRRQCGVCAACLLRRMSVYAAGQREEPATYVWENLSADEFEQGAAQGFTHITRALREYAVAGVLHLDQLADIRNSPEDAPGIARFARQLSGTTGLPGMEVEKKLNRLLAKHESEWEAFVGSLGSKSFVAKWVKVNCRAVN